MIEQKQLVLTLVRRLPAVAFAIALLLTSLPAEAARDCRGRLEFDEVYECEFRSDLSSVGLDGSLLFEEFDGNAFQATLDILGDVSVGYCTCKTSPPNRFDRSKAFECVTGFAQSVAETFEGNVTGNGDEIYKGQTWSSDPGGGGFARFSFDCNTVSDDDSETDSDDDGDSEGDDDDDSDGDDSDDDDKVVLCHKGRKTLEVPSSSVQDHLDHGDELGSCE